VKKLLLLLLGATACGAEAATEHTVEIPPALPAAAASEVVDAAAPDVAVAVIAEEEPTVTFGSSWTQDDAGAPSNPNDIQLTLDFSQIRKHPDGARLGRVLGATPQWRDMLPDTAKIDIVRDLDWMRLKGPSLVHLAQDDIYVRYSLADSAVDGAIDTLVKKRSGSAINLHVAGAKAWKVMIDRSDEQAFVRATPHVVAVVPPTHATDVARALLAHSASAPLVHAEEAMRVRAAHPGSTSPAIPQDISEMRLWVDAHQADGSADVYFEGDCPTSAAARADADAMRAFIAQKNSLGVRLMTKGLLNNVVVAPTGNMVRLRMHATQDQVEAVLSLMANVVHTTLPP